MQSQPSNPPSIQLRPAAQYLRMSTDHQQYSIANQTAAIALYAAAHGIGIVRSFADEGKSGTTIKGRTGLQELLDVVQSGSSDFDVILVYDVSRWGRFSDADEAAHYEFLCKRAGITIHYCAEQFENDDSTASNLLKALKRTMAGEYSRELSVKVSAGQRRLAGMGWWQGGPAPFGMRRRIVGEDGESKQILKCGQCKSVSTDRVILTPGPREEVETIQLVFDLYTRRRKTRHQITQILNERKWFWGKQPWNIIKVRCLLTNPVYKGAYAYAKRPYGRNLSPDKWRIREHSFPAIITDRQWARANELVREETSPWVDSEMLEGLRQLWKEEGRLNSQLISAMKGMPSVEAYKNHFGSLNEANKRIGYPVPRDLVYEGITNVIKGLRDALCEDIRAQIRAVNGNAESRPGRGVLLVNENVRLRVKCTTGRLWRGKVHYGQILWRLSFLGRRTEDILIIARLLPPQQTIMDYFVVPTFSQFRGVMYSKRENNPPFMQIYCFPTLQPLIEAFRRYSVEVED
jgi:DNA invertase Pin-like site-specific DNA recombinase